MFKEWMISRSSRRMRRISYQGDETGLIYDDERVLYLQFKKPGIIESNIPATAYLTRNSYPMTYVHHGWLVRA
jgi:hypothetical protein